MAEEEYDEGLDDVDEPVFAGSVILAIKRQVHLQIGSFLTMFCAAIAMHREFDILVPSSINNGIPLAITMPFIGDVAGVFMAMSVLPLVGRKVALLVSHVLFILPSVGVVAGLDPRTEFYLIFLIHLATRFFLVTFAIYFAEVTDRWLRAPLIGSRFVLYDTGHIIATHAFDRSNMGCLLVIILQLISLGISVLLPETPYYLALRGKREDAEAQYDWLRGNLADPDEMENMVSRAEADGEQLGLQLGLKTFLMPLLVVLCMELGTFGSIPVTYYEQTAIEHIYQYHPSINLNDEVFGAHTAIVYEEFLFLLMKLLAVPLIAVLPRRALYLGIVLLSMIACTSYLYAGFNSTLVYQVVTAYKFIVTLGGEQLSHISSTEIFPGLLRSFGVSFGQLFQSGVEWATLYTLHVPNHIENFVLLVYGVVPLSFVLSFVFMPETFGLTLEEAEDTGGYVAFGLFRNYLMPAEGDESMAEE